MTNGESHKAFLDADDVGVVGYFEKDDSPLATTFHAIAKKLREKVRFAHTSTKKLLEKTKHKQVSYHIVRDFYPCAYLYSQEYNYN